MSFSNPLDIIKKNCILFRRFNNNGVEFCFFSMFTKAVITLGYKNLFLIFSFAATVTGQIQSIPLAPDSNTVTTDKTPETDLIDIDASSAFTREAPHVGDTLSYVVTVEWQNPKVPFTVLAPESLTFKGFKKRKVSTQHRKIARVQDGKPVLINHSEFKYQLEAALSGAGQASSAKLPYFSALSKEREYFHVPPQLIDILPARVPILKRWYVLALLGLFAVLLLWLAVKVAIFRLSSRKKSKAPSAPDLQSEVTALKSRLGTAEPKAILLEMEALCIRFLQHGQKTKQSASFNSLLEARLPGETANRQSAWRKLERDFELAKFGGGQKAPHELAETYQTLKTCLQINKKGDNP
jgi:hypothetical protein